MKKLFLAAFCGLFCLGAIPPQGCDCNPNPSEDADVSDAGADAHVTVDASTDATVADTARADTAGTDRVGTDTVGEDVWSPCTPYEPLDGWQDGWTCDISHGTNTASCGFTLAVTNGLCYLWCWDHQTGGQFRCQPPTNFAHGSSFSSFACTAFGTQHAISCER